MTLLDLGTARVGTAPFAVRHTLCDDPRLSLDALASLAAFLPADRVEQNLGALPDVLPGGDAPRAALTPAEVVRTIEGNGCWMVLKNVELHPGYRDLLDATLDEAGAVGRREGFVFLSAPGSVTPVHMDPEHNFLLQVRGTKQMYVGSWSGPAHEQVECERYYAGGHRNLDRLPPSETRFALGPGDGVYVPVHAPHRVANGPSVSVSLSITWHTEETERAALVHAANAKLRGLGLRPKPPGGPLDPVKAGALRAWRTLRR